MIGGITGNGALDLERRRMGRRESSFGGGSPLWGTESRVKAGRVVCGGGGTLPFDHPGVSLALAVGESSWVRLPVDLWV